MAFKIPTCPIEYKQVLQEKKKSSTQLQLEFQDIASEYNHIYTDGSKDGDRVGCAAIFKDKTY